MYKQFIRVSLGLIVINLAITSCGALSGEYNEKHYSMIKENAQLKFPNLNQLLEPHRGIGISAWGIVALVVLFFLAVVGMYFFSICFPVICQKDKKKYLIDA